MSIRLINKQAQAAASTRHQLFDDDAHYFFDDNDSTYDVDVFDTTVQVTSKRHVSNLNAAATAVPATAIRQQQTATHHHDDDHHQHHHHHALSFESQLLDALEDQLNERATQHSQQQRIVLRQQVKQAQKREWEQKQMQRTRTMKEGAALKIILNETVSDHA